MGVVEFLVCSFLMGGVSLVCWLNTNCWFLLQTQGILLSRYDCWRLLYGLLQVPHHRGRALVVWRLCSFNGNKRFLLVWEGWRSGGWVLTTVLGWKWVFAGDWLWFLGLIRLFWVVWGLANRGVHPICHLGWG